MADRGPLPSWLASLPARVYGWQINRRNRAFDAGRGVVTFDRPVISIGNLSAGGTGKTPVAMQVLRWLRDAESTPTLAMRNYRAAPGQLGDEAKLYRQAFPDLPIVARSDRTLGLIELFGTEEGQRVDCIVLDDGFQHRRIARQADIVLLDMRHPPWRDALIPAGYLREGVESLRRATAVVLTHVNATGEGELREAESRISGASGPALVARAVHRWSCLRETLEGTEHDLPVAWLSGLRVVATCAIGRPDGFYAQLEEIGAKIVHRLTLPDHGEYGPSAVRELASEARRAQAIVCTEKDWMKLMQYPAETWECPVVRPQLAIEFLLGEDDLRAHVLEVSAREIE